MYMYICGCIIDPLYNYIVYNAFDTVDFCTQSTGDDNNARVIITYYIRIHYYNV